MGGRWVMKKKPRNDAIYFVMTLIVHCLIC